MRKFLLMLSLLITFAASAAESIALRVIPTSGEPVTFLLDTKPEVQFSGQTLVISSTAQPVGVRFEMDKVDNIDFTTVTALNEMEQPGITVTYATGMVTFANIPADTDISVYTTDGRCVTQTRATGEFSLSVSDLAAGIYIVRVGTFVTKISF